MSGKFTVKAGQHLFKSGGQVVSHFPVIPKFEGGFYNVSVQLTDGDNVPHKNKAYFAVTQSGEMIEGVTDAEGYTKTIYTKNKEDVSFHLVDRFLDENFDQTEEE